MKRDAAPDEVGGADAPSVRAGAARRAIRQDRPFRSLSQEATLSVLVAAERLRRRVSELVEGHGITIQQYNVLRILRGAHPDPLPTLEIGERMIESTPGVTRLMDRLEEKGWVSRVRCQHDRRQVHCSVTRQGLDLLAALDPQMDALDERTATVLNEAELATLIGLLDRLIDGYLDEGGDAA